MRFAISFATFAVALTASSAAFADGPTFGAAGQLAISSDANLQLTHTSVTDGGDSTTILSLRPAADFFVIDDLSIGGFVLFENDSSSGATESTTTFGIGPRVGYNLAISDTFSFWPKVGLSFQHVSAGTASETSFNVALFAPFLVHPAQHFFLGLGPIVSTDLANNVSGAGGGSAEVPKATTFGLAFTLGGWIGL
jgi:hypothetical protein